MGTLTQGFRMSEQSLTELCGVHPDLVAVVWRALQLTRQDFAVHDGLRTMEEQRTLVAAGASQTVASRHIKGCAVDLVPVINGKLRWEWGAIYPIAEAMRTAATELNISVRWGGNWSDLLGTTESPEQLVAAYVEARRRQGKRAFIDGPHFELPLRSATYPGVDPEGLGSAWQGVSP